MITELIGWCKGKMNYSSNKHQISLTLGIDLDSLQSPMKPPLLKNNNTTDDQNLEKSLFPFLSKQGVFSHCRKIAHHSNFSGIISQHCYVALKMTLVKSEKVKEIVRFWSSQVVKRNGQLLKIQAFLVFRENFEARNQSNIAEDNFFRNISLNDRHL